MALRAADATVIAAITLMALLDDMPLRWLIFCHYAILRHYYIDYADITLADIAISRHYAIFSATP